MLAALLHVLFLQFSFYQRKLSVCALVRVLYVRCVIVVLVCGCARREIMDLFDELSLIQKISDLSSSARKSNGMLLPSK